MYSRREETPVEQPENPKNLDIRGIIRSSKAVCEMYIDRRLTKREAVCLWFAARGKTSLETAKLLGIKKSTVETHRKRIKQKLSCRNLTQAAFEGLFCKGPALNKLKRIL